jgi:multidrug efflux pump subunit AcrB
MSPVRRFGSGVLLALSLALGGCSGCWPQCLSSATSTEHERALTVEAVYPGADASTVMHEVAAVLEPQLTGIEKLTDMRSESAADGSYFLELFFQRGVDLKQARLLAQNRIALALPVLPHSVTRLGLALRDKRPSVIAILILSSPELTRDVRYLREYADRTLKAELMRPPAIDHVSALGGDRPRCRIWPDAEKMQSEGVQILDVARAFDGRNEAGLSDKQALSNPEKEIRPPLLADLPRGFASVEEIANRIVKADAKNHAIRLRDVALVEWRDGPPGHATFNGAPIVAIAVHPTREVRPREVSVALRERLSSLKSELPPGVRLELDFDFAQNIEVPDDPTTENYLLLDVLAPDSASPERIVQNLNRCETALKGMDGVRDTLTLTQPIFERGSTHASVLVRVAPSRNKQSTREALVTTIRARLNGELPDALIRLRDLAGASRFPSCSYPLDIAVVDTENRGYDALQFHAERLAEKLGHAGEITDAIASRGSVPVEAVSTLFDLNKAAAVGVLESELISALSVYFAGAVSELIFSPGSSTLTARLQPSHRELEQFSQLRIRGSDGRTVPLASVAQIRRIPYIRSFERLDGLPMVRITAGFSTGLSAALAHARCERVIKELDLPVGYQVRWLTELSR